MKNIAIISPKLAQYSETFIQAHRQIGANIFFYYGGELPLFLEGEGRLDSQFSTDGLKGLYLRERIFRKCQKYNMSPDEFFFESSLKEKKIDAVLAEFGGTGVAVLETCRRNRIPLVPVFHGEDVYVKGRSKTYKRLYKKLFDYSQSVIVVSMHMKARIVELGCPPSKIFYSPCAPANEFFEIPALSEISNKFISIGRFVNKKAPYYTVLAFQKVLKDFPTAELIMAGDGPLWEMVQNYVMYQKLEASVKLVGVQKHEDIVKLLANSTCFVQHSITSISGDSEGTPVGVLEAMAAGRPVISTKHAGISEVVDQDCGLLVDEHDVDGMAEAMSYILRNKEASLFMGRVGRDKVLGNYSMKKHIEVIELALLRD